jgi:hypothetical protein
MLAEVDQRSAYARRFKELVIQHQLDRGGLAALSAAENSIIKHASVLEIELELRASKFALADGATDEELVQYQQAANSLRRLFESIGLKRQNPRDVTPSLEAYLTKPSVHK